MTLDFSPVLPASSIAMIALVLSLALIQSVLTKTVSPLLTLSKDTRWVYTSKYVLGEASGLWTFKAKIVKPVNETSSERSFLQINVYTESTWEEALLASTCEQKTSISRQKRVKVPEDGSWSTPMKGTLSQGRGAQIWYFAISDCERNLPDVSKLRVEFTITSRTGSEFSYEQQGLVYLYLLGTALFTGGLFVCSYELRMKFKRTDYTDSRQFSLAASVCLQFLSLLFQFLHLWIYSHNGYGVILLDFFSQAFASFSEFTITVVMILISAGWTLKFRDFSDPDVYILPIVLVVLVQVVLVCIGKVLDDAYYKFTAYETTAGWMLLGVKVGLWGWFVWNIKRLYAGLTGKMKDFILSFAVFGSIYLLATPLTVLVSVLFPVYQRVTILAFGNIVIQGVSFWLLHELFGDKGTYYKLSTASEGVLPGKLRSY